MSLNETPPEAMEFVAWSNKLVEIMPILLQTDSAESIPKRADMVLLDFTQFLFELISSRPEEVTRLDHKLLMDVCTALEMIDETLDYDLPGPDNEVEYPSLKEMVRKVTSPKTLSQLAVETRDRI